MSIVSVTFGVVIGEYDKYFSDSHLRQIKIVRPQLTSKEAPLMCLDQVEASSFCILHGWFGKTTF